MDPNETLRRIRALTAQGDTLSVGDVMILVGLVTNLDEWMSYGGFPPTAWESSFWPVEGVGEDATQPIAGAGSQ